MKLSRRILKLLKKLLKALKRWLNKDITTKYYVWYFYFILLILSFMIIKKYNPDDLYSYGINNEIHQSNICSYDSNGLYCIDKVYVNWYEKINK